MNRLNSFVLYSLKLPGNRFHSLLTPILCLSLILAAPVFASENPDNSTPPIQISDQVVSDNAVFRARRATNWQSEGVRYLLLEYDVIVTVGQHIFNARNAVVRIEITAHDDNKIKNLWIYFDDVRSQSATSKIQIESSRVLVTASTLGQVDLTTDLLLKSKRQPDDQLVTDAMARFSRYGETAANPVAPAAVTTTAAATATPADDQTQQTQPAKAPTTTPPTSAPAARPPAIPSAPPGTVSARADRVSYQSPAEGETESTLCISGNIWVVYESADGKTDVTMTAQKAVIILTGEPSSNFAIDALNNLDLENIVGVYLEDDVEVTSGQFTTRAPRVYYDLQTHKAIVLDAVFFTWSADLKLPIYLRAKQLRQHSLSKWSATGARLTTSEFAEPHFSIAAGKITINRTRTETGQSSVDFTAKDTTINWYDLPLFYFPGLSGKPTDIPLKSGSVGYDSDDGFQFQSQWDMFNILSRQPPNGVTMTGNVDFLGERGPGLGLDLNYRRPQMFGRGFGYLLLYDQGTDRIDQRDPISFDGEMRGVLNVRHKQFLENDWMLALELGYVSDPTFLEEFFPRDAHTDKPYETSIYLKKQQDDWAFTFLAKDQVINFLPQTTVAQYPQYTVDKLPEAEYFQIGTSLFDDTVTYQTENRLGFVKISGGADSPADRGFDDMQSMMIFGYAPAMFTFRDAQTARGITAKTVGRLDTRHELNVPMKIDIFDVVPFVAGRATLYDHDFDDFGGDSQPYQFWGGAGIRLHTQLNKTFSHFTNQVLDIHRLRHVIEPMVDLFWSDAYVNPLTYPIYDVDVEGILDDGSTMRFGVRNTLQTQRGGPGRWRTVDWIVLDLNFVIRDGSPDQDALLPKYIPYRPEFSTGGDHFRADLQWMVSDTMAAVGDVIYNFELDMVEQWRLGTAVEHTDRLLSYIDYNQLTGFDSRLLGFGFTYELTKKYDVGFRQTFDFGRDDNQDLDITVVRHLPRWQLVFEASFDEINDDRSIRVLLVPQGSGESRLQKLVTSSGGYGGAHRY